MNQTDTATFGCEREGCNPAESGCIDGLAVSECPRRLRIDPIEDTLVEEPSDPLVSGPVKVVHNGDAFTFDEADAFLRRRGGRVIAFIGCPDVGKTTAAVMLYEMAKRRKLGAFRFAGSRTIRGFQERAHLALFSSGNKVPDTPRTPVSKPPSFLHLELLGRDAANGELRLNLLLSDRTGEDFLRAIEKPSLVLSYPEIERADCHVILVDGKRLADTDDGPRHLNQVRRLIRALADNKAFSTSDLLQLALTKHDEVLKSPNADGAFARFSLIVASAKNYVPTSVRVTEHKLAARPLTQDLALGDGLISMLNDWLPCLRPRHYTLSVPKLKSGRMYDRLNNILEEV